MDRHSALVAFGILCSRLTGFIRQRVLRPIFRPHLIPPTRSWRRSAFPIFCRTCLAKARCLRRSFPCMRRSSRERSESRPRASQVRLRRCSRSSRRHARAARRARDAAARHADRAGLRGEKRELTIAIVRILFPGAGLLVLSAWCLGILNSHRRFLLSYIAPVIWNVSMIVTLAWWGALAPLPRLAVMLAWGAVVGSALQMLVQLPRVLSSSQMFASGSSSPSTCARRSEISCPCSSAAASCRSALISTKCWRACCPTGAVTGLANAQLLYTLPVKPVRPVGLCSGAARHVGRGRARRDAPQFAIG